MTTSPTPAPRTDLAGIDRLKAMIDGPGAAPLGVLLGFRCIEVADGIAVFEGTPNADHFNPQGIVHGGWTASVLDSALGCAIETRIVAGHSYGTVELKVNYVRPVTDRTGLMTCRGEIVHFGRRMATSQGRLVDADGRLYAHGSCTCMIYEV